MEVAITAFCQSLASFCHHVQSSSQALSDSIQRRPIPLDSAASAFLQCVDRRISSTSTDLNLLESMAFGTVSFEELLGHCNEVYKTNQKYISDLQDRMRLFGYVPEMESDDEGWDADSGIDSKFMSPVNNGVDKFPVACGSVSVARSNRKRLEEDSLFEDSISLQSLGLSDACLATLASEGNDYTASPMISSQHLISPNDREQHAEATPFETPKEVFSPSGDSKTMIKTSRDDYDSLPPYMKSLASWEELQEAVVKMNSYLCKDRAKSNDAFNQDDLETMGLGRKGRSYLLLLLRMNQLVVETVDGCIFYRIHV
ncbi:uncharacterized protein LOC103720602 isoform X2 [Phoenix dactylifera]|uniref:Uncharacterized protein LOC103720602 isoform X2 n=1 Tax=Phoenix dactylifera TaxID=42345 RepID=A0A8B9ADE3_PHODC|nr:uncharacterized protein LOC103720602 isoform X2 [Phoenix dactylifera]